MSDKEYEKSSIYRGLDSLSLGVGIAGIAIGIGLAFSDNNLGEDLKAIEELRNESNEGRVFSLTCEFSQETFEQDIQACQDFLEENDFTIRYAAGYDAVNMNLVPRQP